MKKSYKVLDQPFIKGFVRFYQSAESDITSIAVAYYFDLHFPFDADCSQYFAFLLSYSSYPDSFKFTKSASLLYIE